MRTTQWRTCIAQAVVFLNAADKAQALAERLNEAGYPSAFVSGGQAQVSSCRICCLAPGPPVTRCRHVSKSLRQDSQCSSEVEGHRLQVDRMDTIAAVHGFRVRVVVATDVAARGLDLSAVNLVGPRLIPTWQAVRGFDVARRSDGACTKLVIVDCALPGGQPGPAIRWSDLHASGRPRWPLRHPRRGSNICQHAGACLPARLHCRCVGQSGIVCFVRTLAWPPGKDHSTACCRSIL